MSKSCEPFLPSECNNSTNNRSSDLEKWIHCDSYLGSSHGHASLFTNRSQLLEGHFTGNWTFYRYLANCWQHLERVLCLSLRRPCADDRSSLYRLTTDSCFGAVNQCPHFTKTFTQGNYIIVTTFIVLEICFIQVWRRCQNPVVLFCLCFVFTETFRCSQSQRNPI